MLNNHEPVNLIPKKPLKYDAPTVNITNITLSSPPSYKIDDLVATRKVYGTAIVKLAQTNPRVIALDADVSNSTFANKMKEYDRKRFIECYIAEQNMVGVAIGATCRDRTVAFVSTFGAFLARTFDQIRMGGISRTNTNFVGSHCGISIGQDGPSQMALEDIAMFRTIPGATVFYPSDAVSTEKAIELAANTKGICYIRTTRLETPVVYQNDQYFQIGLAHVIGKKSSKDQVLVIGACVTLLEAMKAAKELKESGVYIRVLDPFTIKPIDKDTIIENAKEVGGRIITVEDHYIEGGLGEAVMNAVAAEKDITVKQLAVKEVPRSGPPTDLLDKFEISAPHIVKAVQEILE